MFLICLVIPNNDFHPRWDTTILYISYYKELSVKTCKNPIYVAEGGKADYVKSK